MSTFDDVRLRRGLLLLALHDQYPHKLTQVSLERQVGAFYAGDPRALSRDLEYLREKGYARDQSDQVGSRTVRAWELTATGVDLVEGSVDDPGVTIVRGS